MNKKIICWRIEFGKEVIDILQAPHPCSVQLTIYTTEITEIVKNLPKIFWAILTFCWVRIVVHMGHMGY